MKIDKSKNECYTVKNGTFKKEHLMKISKYDITTKKKGINIKLACVSDLHARPYGKVIAALEAISPNAILLPGDIVEIAAEFMDKRNQNGLNFLQEATRIAPCYYTYGNHEIYYSHARGKNPKTPEPALSKRYLDAISSYGVHLINDSFEALEVTNEVLVGGLVCGRDMDPALDQKDPDLNFLSDYSKKSGFKILLCHYPHYYERYLKDIDVDLVLSGHAHGGQWRIFGRGVYAPHQGLFPKYTSGIHDGKHIISRGAVNNSKPIPRFFNPCEVIEINIHS